MCSGIASDKITHDVNNEGKITQEIDEKGKSIHIGIVGKEITWEDDGGYKSIHSGIVDNNQYGIELPLRR